MILNSVTLVVPLGANGDWRLWETVISVEKIDRTLLMQKLQQAEKVLTF